jgi:MFS superfamily sulfate permease-like transporter
MGIMNFIAAVLGALLVSAVYVTLRSFAVDDAGVAEQIATLAASGMLTLAWLKYMGRS